MKKYQTNDNYLDTIDTEEKAYVLGLITADGYHSEKLNTFYINLIESDKNLLEKVNSLFNINRELRKVLPRKEQHKVQYQMIVTSKLLSKRLIELGIRSNKSHTCLFSDDVPEHLIHHYMRGIFDGDGCISISKMRQGVFTLTGNKALVQKFESVLLRYVPVKPFTTAVRNADSKNIITIMKGGNVVVPLIFKFLYKDASIFIERKYQKFLSLPRTDI